MATTSKLFTNPSAIEKLLAPLELGDIPDFSETPCHEIYDGFNSDIEKLLEETESETSLEVTPANGELLRIKELTSTSGGIDVGVAERSMSRKEFDDTLFAGGIEARLRVQVPFKKGKESPAEVVQFTTVFRNPHTAYDQYYEWMKLSHGIVIPKSPFLEALGIDRETYGENNPIIDTTSMLEESVLNKGWTRNPQDEGVVINCGPRLKQAFAVASAVLTRLKD